MSELFLKILEGVMWLVAVLAVFGIFFGSIGSILAMINVGKYFWKTRDNCNNSDSNRCEHPKRDLKAQKREWDLEVSAKLEFDCKQQQSAKQLWVDIRTKPHGETTVEFISERDA